VLALVSFLPASLVKDRLTKMSQAQEGGARSTEDESSGSATIGKSPQSRLREVWQNNKGMFLILLAVITGSSMDAIVRFLQQGGGRMHAFQVGEIRKASFEEMNLS
jgi:hypothetical protein